MEKEEVGGTESSESAEKKLLAGVLSVLAVAVTLATVFGLVLWLISGN